MRLVERQVRTGPMKGKIAKHKGIAIGAWRRCAAWLALLGLLLQVAVSSTHHHPDELRLKAGLGWPVVVATASQADDGGAPVPKKSPDRPDKDYCLVCLGLQLAGTFIAADPAWDAALSSLGVAEDLRAETPALQSRPYLLFRTRAPPTA